MREIKRRVVRDPARQSWTQISVQVRSHIQITTRWTTAQPLDRAAYQKVDVPVSGVELDQTGRLVNIQQHERAFRMRAFDNRANVNPITAAIRRMRESDEGGLIVDRIENS